jgi:hypothetical protein
MGNEYERIHFETSSVLICQFPANLLKQPYNWILAPFEGGKTSENLLYVPKEEIVLGKKDLSVFGWDNEYNYLTNKYSKFLCESKLNNKSRISRIC